MSSKIPSHCPACGSTLAVQALRCTSCKTVVEGDYPLSRFLLLTPEQLHFCELFLKARGNLKDVCTALGISYPTARNRMDELLKALGYEQEPRKDERMNILERLTRGEITHEQALKLLQGKDGESL